MRASWSFLSCHCFKLLFSFYAYHVSENNLINVEESKYRYEKSQKEALKDTCYLSEMVMLYIALVTQVGSSFRNLNGSLDWGASLLLQVFYLHFFLSAHSLVPLRRRRRKTTSTNFKRPWLLLLTYNSNSIRSIYSLDIKSVQSLRWVKHSL